MGCFYLFCPCQVVRPSLTEESIQRGSKKREIDALKRRYKQEKGLNFIEIWGCEWWRLYKGTNNVKQHFREHFPNRRSDAAEQLLKETKTGKFFGSVQCDIELLEKLISKIDSFRQNFKNTLVSKNDIGDLMKNYVDEARLMSQPQKRLISSFTLKKWITYYSSVVVPSTIGS